ncbi:toxin-antitoxin system HicB family antitoxin [Isoptericola halotolerans]|uniref:toxin-antitoxin system HicB family antitoxin n=1 Tax=Isoptericola halotolerans TaxID=300560 RepID=UPI001A9C7AF0
MRREHDLAAKPVPQPLSERTCSGEFRVRIPPRTHRRLVEQAADDRISLTVRTSTVSPQPDHDEALFSSGASRVRWGRFSPVDRTSMSRREQRRPWWSRRFLGVLATPDGLCGRQ